MNSQIEKTANSENDELLEFLQARNLKNEKRISSLKEEMKEKRDWILIYNHQIFELKEEKQLHIVGGKIPLNERQIQRVATKHGIETYTVIENEIINREHKPYELKYLQYILKY